MSDLKKNQVHTVDIQAYNSEAMGVCRLDGQAVFVPGTIEGEKWEIKLVKLSSSANYARAENILCASDLRFVPECPHFAKCGGCDTWHMRYEEELRFKLSKVNNALSHIGKQSLIAEEILGADSVYHYRNKGILAVGTVDGRIRAGFYRQRSHEL
ncbi:MAG: TRAM domain-containing protein, partial [Oscillospiraceae bacterium]|nr:TRAM domain-containing protein [Oscillospiraceae bacterium]